jgi:4-amino-4-deoxy-L-arabinose transferase-like glycosyltransferase
VKATLRSYGLELGLLAALAGFVLWGIPRVPFHPDETSLLFESRDLELLTTSPLSMAWHPGMRPSRELEYRLLNSPLPKYVLGLGRRAAGFGPESVSVDWDWSKTWRANAAAGALPSEDLLSGARAASSLALLAAVIATYLAGKRLGGRAVGLAAGVLMGLNALSLLHGRRAMAEGTLLMGVALAVVGILQADRRPLWAGLTLALAFNAKASTLALVPVAMLAAAWPSERSGSILASALRRVVLLTVAFVGVTWVLQPVLWQYPLQSLQAMWTERQELLARQVADIQAVAPDHVVSGAPQRTAVLIGNLYVAPLQFAEVGNYLAETQDSVLAYQRVFGHSLLRGSVGGGVLLALTLLGMVWGWRRSRRESPAARRAMMLMLLGTVVQGAALVAAIPLPIQRYSLPLLPFVCLWQGLGFAGGWPRPETRRRPSEGGIGQG